jgi:hypothetical protein
MNIKLSVIQKILRKLPRCKKCNQLIFSTCDRGKPPELVKYKGIMAAKMWMYPTAEEQSKICSYCESKMHPPKVGKES